jgi:hypothetical protein
MFIDRNPPKGGFKKEKNRAKPGSAHLKFRRLRQKNHKFEVNLRDTETLTGKNKTKQNKKQ